jgi:sodium-dependent dicarboxylate transporter 2/3/5
MGTIIGSPPNAIAASLLQPVQPVDFVGWSLLALPPALLLFALLWSLLARQVTADPVCLPPAAPRPDGGAEGSSAVRRWQRLATLAVFLGTIALWITGAWHGLPTAVVSFFPIVALSMIGVIRQKDMRSIDWDVLILLAGGLSLGVGIEQSGLAAWLADLISQATLPPWLAALCLAWLVALLSNLMSNTAAANILLPVTIVIAQALGEGTPFQAFVIPVALACSMGIALPISTPPNAIVYASGHLAGRHFLPTGLLAFIVGPPLAVGWCLLMA